MGFFPGKWLEPSQLCSGSVQPCAGYSRVELGSEGLGCRMLTAGRVPHSLCVRGERAASQLSVFQNTLPLHGFQTGCALKLCWKYLGLGRFLSGENFIPRGLSEKGQESPKTQGIQWRPPPWCHFPAAGPPARPHSESAQRHRPPRVEAGGGDVLQEAYGGVLCLRLL